MDESCGDLVATDHQVNFNLKFGAISSLFVLMGRLILVMEILKMQYTGAAHAVASSPNGRQLASASAGKMVMLFDVATGVALEILKGHTGTVSTVAFSPDGGQLASASGRQDGQDMGCGYEGGSTHARWPHELGSWRSVLTERASS